MAGYCYPSPTFIANHVRFSKKAHASCTDLLTTLKKVVWHAGLLRLTLGALLLEAPEGLLFFEQLPLQLHLPKVARGREGFTRKQNVQGGGEGREGAMLPTEE